MRLDSVSFTHCGEIPKRFTAEDKRRSPWFRWHDVPSGTKSFVFVCRDMDWPKQERVLWLLTRIPGNAQGLEGRMNEKPEAMAAWGVALNDAGQKDYEPMAPASGSHRYYFNVYALDIELPPQASDMNWEKVKQEIEGHVLAEAQLIGVYTQGGRHAR